VAEAESRQPPRCSPLGGDTPPPAPPDPPASANAPVSAGTEPSCVIRRGLIQLGEVRLETVSALDHDGAWARVKAFAEPEGHLIGVGCDTETRARLAEALDRHPRFLERWYDAGERRSIAGSQDPLGEALRRFCLKEAAIKALWTRVPLTPRQVGTGGAE
jgi:hypothetical protein